MIIKFIRKKVEKLEEGVGVAGTLKAHSPELVSSHEYPRSHQETSQTTRQLAPGIIVLHHVKACLHGFAQLRKETSSLMFYSFFAL